MRISVVRTVAPGWRHLLVPAFLLLTVAALWWMSDDEAEATPADCTSVTAVTFGAAPTAGSIGAAGEKDCFQVAAARGDRIRVRVVENPAGPLVLGIQIFNPSDVSRCSFTVADVTCVLGSTGTHTIQVKDNAGTNTGSYAIAVQRLNDPVGCTTLNFGDAPTTGFISAGEIDCYRIKASANETIWRRVVKTSGALDPSTSIYRPAGTAICADVVNSTRDDLFCELDSTGEHSIFVTEILTGAAGGAYVIGVQNATAPVGCTALSFGAPPTLGTQTESLGGMGCMQVPAVAGDQVRFRVIKTNGSLVPLTTVFGTGTCSGNSNFDTITCPVEATGTVSAFVRDDVDGTKTGSYAIAVQRLNNPVGCVTLSFGAAPVAGSIPSESISRGEMDCFTFSGTAGSQVRVRLVDTSAGATNPSQEVFRPNGTSVCAVSTADDRTCGLDVSGSHTVVVAPPSFLFTGNYAIALQRLSSPVGCTTLSFGAAPTPATISVAGEMDCFKFSGSLGSNVRVRVLRAAGTFDPSSEVIRTNGTTACTPTTTDDSTCAVDTQGTHTVVVSDALGSRTGDYLIAVQRLNSPVGCTALGFGLAPLGAAISVPGEMDCFSFSGAAGGQYRVRVLSTTPGVGPSLEVFRPNGTPVVCTDLGAAPYTCALDTAGSHGVLVKTSGVNTGSYVIAVQRLHSPVGCATVSFGPAPTAGSISATGEMDCFKFSGAPGDQVRLRSVNTSGSLSAVELLRPNGTTACGSPVGYNSTCTLGDSGTHTVLISGGSPADYAFALQRLNNPVGCTTVTFGATTSATISIAGEVDCFRISASAADRVRVLAAPTAPGANPHVEVHRPNGTSRCTPGTNDETTCALDTTGTHTVVVTDAGGPNTGNYVISLHRLNALTGCTTLSFGAGPTAAAISAPGELDCFQFSASRGDRVWTRVVKTSGSLTLSDQGLRPNGSRMCGSNPVFQDSVCSITTTGTHKLVVSDQAATATGDYVVLVQLLNAPVGCTELEGEPEVLGSISSAGEMDCVRFYGTAGSEFTFAITPEGTLSPSVIVIRPSGTTACNNEFTTIYYCTLDTTGEHTFLIRDAAGTGTGSYSVEVSAT